MVTSFEMDVFYSNYFSDFCRVFRVLEDYSVRNVVFSNTEFKTAFLPDDVFGDVDISAIVNAAHGVGDTRLIITNVEALPFHSCNIDIEISREFWEIASMIPDCCVSLFSQAIFGRSGKWGILVDKYNECIAVGGQNEFIDRFVLALGGWELLNNEFMQWARKFWKCDDCELTKVLRMNGWPF